MSKKARRQQFIQALIPYLNRFWFNAEVRTARLTLLKDMAEFRERNRCRKTRRGWFQRFGKFPCFVGCGRMCEHAHHVIQLQHGGADIDLNKVPLCSICHAEIHPWMAGPDEPVTKRPFWA
jgi:hypothetical protein